MPFLLSQQTFQNRLSLLKRLRQYRRKPQTPNLQVHIGHLVHKGALPPVYLSGKMKAVRAHHLDMGLHSNREQMDTGGVLPMDLADEVVPL